MFPVTAFEENRGNRCGIDAWSFSNHPFISQTLDRPPQRPLCYSGLLLVNLGFLGFSQKLVFFIILNGIQGVYGVSRRTAPTVRSYMQIFSRFVGTWHRKVHFSTFFGKLTFQCTRNCPQNPPFCPGSLQDTFIIYSSISHQHNFRKDFPKKKESRELKT